MPDYWVCYQCPKADMIGDTIVSTTYPLNKHHVDSIRVGLAKEVMDGMPPSRIRIEVGPRDVFVTNIFPLAEGNYSHVTIREHRYA